MTEAMQSRLASPIKAPDETTFGYAWEDWVNAIGDAGDILQEYAQAAYDLYSAAAE